MSSTKKPILLVVLDTEEEFEWGAPRRRDATSVNAMRSIHLAQEVFDSYRIRPTYVIDYPVASQETGWKPLKEFQDSGRAVVGAHLHPWVNPPHEEELTSFNSYVGNLDPRLERTKLRILTDTIEQNVGRRPTIYKAGRYGFGPNTTAILEELGYQIDLSVAPAFDYTGDGGPDYSTYPTDYYVFGNGRTLYEFPTTGAFVGYWRWNPGAMYRIATNPALQWARLPGILSRIGALDRLRLSPEDFTPAEHVKLTRALLAAGCRTFTFSFHSPSVHPGCTPYVRSEADRAQFLDACRRYFDYFLGEVGGIALTPHEALELLHEENNPGTLR
jgi:hypothetical protein